MIGPDIPKYLLEKKQRQQRQSPAVELDEAEADEEVVQDVVREDPVGPSIPVELLAKRRQERSKEEEQPTAPSPPAANDDKDDDPDAFAPALPPDLLEARSRQKSVTTPSNDDSGERRRRRAPAGPALPSRYDDDDDDVVGPSLPTNYNPEKDAVRSAVADIEERALRSKEAMEAEKSEAANPTKKVQREDWMLLPPEVDYLRGADSSKSRGFSTSNLSAREKDRSVWTDTPADKEKKRSEKRKQAEEHGSVPLKYSKHDQEVRQNVQQHNMTERSKSLVELHREKGRNKRRTETEDAASRPFDREKDLLNAPKRGMDKRQKQEMLKSARELGGRFGSGSSSFL